MEAIFPISGSASSRFSSQSLSDFLRHPSKSTDRGQDIEVERDHHHPRRSIGKSYKSNFTLGYRGFQIISQVVESVALVRDSDEDVYYRNDSMKSVGHIGG